jgi:hypothetical protein
MSKRKWVAAKLFAVLGGAGLAIGLCVPRAGAQPPPFSNNSYANRYICIVTAQKTAVDADAVGADAVNAGVTAVLRLSPNGSGSYNDGTLETPIDPFTAFNPGLPPTSNFCTFVLDIAGSSYLLGPDGLGVEVLSWSPPSPNTNPSACPTTTFIMSNEIVLRAFAATLTGRSITTEITSNNFLDQDEAGEGECFK